MSPAESPKTPVTVQRLELRRIAGVSPTSAFTLEDLPEGLVLIYGPNGSGKSTTAAALQSLLWPETTAKNYLDLNGSVSQAGESWELVARGKQVIALQGATEVPHPAWTAPELRGRYHWSLQTLLEGQDGDLAAALAKEMAGGVDFQELSSSLGWSKEPSAPQKISKELREAEKHLSSVRKEQEVLRKEAAEVEDLKSRRAKAVQQRDRLPRIQDARGYLEKTATLKTLEDQLAELPEAAKHIQSGDESRCASLLEKIRTCEEELKRIATRIEEQHEKNPLPKAKISEGDLQSIRRRVEAFEMVWRDQSLERNRAEEDLAAATTKKQRLGERLGLHAQEDSGITGYDLPEIRSWAETVFATYEATAKEASAKNALQLPLEDPLPDAASLHEFLSALRRARGTHSNRYFLDQLPFLAAVISLGGVLFFTWNETSSPWLAALPLILILFLLLWKRIRQTQLLAHSRSLAPEGMATETITLSTLTAVIQKAEHLLDEPRRREEWQNSATQLSEQQSKLTELQDTLTSLGVTPEPSKEWIRNFLEDLQSWRTATDEVAEIEAKLTEQEKRLDHLLESLASTSANVGHSLANEDPLVDAAELVDRVSQKLDQLQTLHTLFLERKDQQQRLSEAEQELKELGDRLHLDSPDPAEVKQLTGHHLEWENLFRRSEVLKQRTSELRNSLEATDPELLELEEPSLKSLQSESETAAETEAGLRDQLSRLEQRMESAESGRGLHDALEMVAEKRQELEDERTRHAEILTGRAILDWLRESCRTREQPELLREANRILAEFTNGSLQLTLNLQEADHAFQAAQPGQEPRSLELLSTGERTQVLMAARLAFLSKHERAPLPLLIDEALGTSDDERATAIMQALLKVVEQGRQVFYFTAQSDEVGKWNAQLDGSPVASRLVDLKALREQTPSAALEFSESFVTEKTDPARQPGEPEEAWAVRLGVPTWTPHQPVEDIPLFLFLREEQDLLQGSLRNGLKTLGPLIHLIRSGSADDVAAPELQAKVMTHTEALRSVSTHWKIGRPPPVDPEWVLESGFVSEAFTKDILNLLEASNYEAAAFIDRLENKEVARWRQDNTNELKSLLYERGFLTDEEALSDEMIISKAMGDLKSSSPSTDTLSIDWPRWVGLCHLGKGS